MNFEPTQAESSTISDVENFLHMPPREGKPGLVK